MRLPPENKPSRTGQHLIVSLLLASLCLLGTGCDMKLPPMPWDPKPKPKAEAAEGGDASGEEGGEEGGEGEGAAKHKPVKVDELDFLPPDMKKLPFQEVNISMNDGMVIYGRLYDPSMKPPKPAGEDSEEGGDEASADSGGDGEGEEAPPPYKGPKYPLVILLHGIDRDHTTWSDLPVSLVKAGYSVFAMDLRGHGKSTHTLHKNRVTWRLFQPEHWLLLPKDVDQVIEHFQKDAKRPQIDGHNVGIVGEKLGANVAVFSGRDMSPAVKALVLISPGLDYKGVIPAQAIIDYTNPALLITTQDDPYSFKSTERLYNWLLGVKAMQVYKKIGDGSDMLSHQSALGENITEWLINQMPSPAKPKTAEKLPEPARQLATEETESKTAEGKKPDTSAKASTANPEKAKPSTEKPATAKPGNHQPDTTHRDLPQDRLGQADNSTASAGKKAGSKTKPAQPAKKAHKTPAKNVSKSAPTPPSADSGKGAPTPGSAPIPGG